MLGRREARPISSLLGVDGAFSICSPEDADAMGRLIDSDIRGRRRDVLREFPRMLFDLLDGLSLMLLSSFCEFSSNDCAMPAACFQCCRLLSAWQQHKHNAQAPQTFAETRLAGHISRYRAEPALLSTAACRSNAQRAHQQQRMLLLCAFTQHMNCVPTHTHYHSYT